MAKSKKEETFKYCVMLSFSVNTLLCLFLTILQAKKELLILQQLSYGVQAYVDGVHINQRLQNIGSQPSSTTRRFGVIKYS